MEIIHQGTAILIVTLEQVKDTTVRIGVMDQLPDIIAESFVAHISQILHTLSLTRVGLIVIDASSRRSLS